MSYDEEIEWQNRYCQFTENNTVRENLPGVWDAVFALSSDDLPSNVDFANIELPATKAPVYHEVTLKAERGHTLTIRPYKGTHFEVIRSDVAGNSVSDFYDPQHPATNGKIINTIEGWVRNEYAHHPELQKRVDFMREYVARSAQERIDEALQQAQSAQGQGAPGAKP